MTAVEIVQIILLGFILLGVIRLHQAFEKKADAPVPNPTYPAYVIMTLKQGMTVKDVYPKVENFADIMKLSDKDKDKAQAKAEAELDLPQWCLGKEFDLPIPPVAGQWIGDSHQVVIDRVEVDTIDRLGTIAVFASKIVRPSDASSEIASALDYGWHKHHWSDKFPDDVDDFRSKMDQT